MAKQSLSTWHFWLIGLADTLFKFLRLGLTKPMQRGTLFARQAIPMTWDFAEANPISDSSGTGNEVGGTFICKVFEYSFRWDSWDGMQADAATQNPLSTGKIVSIDPPYYDNICYADLSDFFYVWLRRSHFVPVLPRYLCNGGYSQRPTS